MWSGDPWARARRATREMEKHLAAIARLADERAVAVRELLDGGLTRAEVARRLGVTPAVVTKILKRPVVVGANGTSGTGSSPGRHWA
jgi:DNA invertase Pin-like site-specific DNA recombinase